MAESKLLSNDSSTTFFTGFVLFLDTFVYAVKSAKGMYSIAYCLICFSSNFIFISFYSAYPKKCLGVEQKQESELNMVENTQALRIFVKDKKRLLISRLCLSDEEHYDLELIHNNCVKIARHSNTDDISLTGTSIL